MQQAQKWSAASSAPVIDDSTLAAVVTDQRLVGGMEDDDRLFLSPFCLHRGQQNLSFPGDAAPGTHERGHHQSCSALGKFTLSTVQGQGFPMPGQSDDGADRALHDNR